MRKRRIQYRLGVIGAHKTGDVRKVTGGIPRRFSAAITPSAPIDDGISPKRYPFAKARDKTCRHISPHSQKVRASLSRKAFSTPCSDSRHSAAKASRSLRALRRAVPAAFARSDFPVKSLSSVIATSEAIYSLCACAKSKSVRRYSTTASEKLPAHQLQFLRERGHIEQSLLQLREYTVMQHRLTLKKGISFPYRFRELFPRQG